MSTQPSPKPKPTAPAPPTAQKPIAQKPIAQKDDHGPTLLTAIMFLGVTWLLLNGFPSMRPVELDFPRLGLSRLSDRLHRLRHQALPLGRANWVSDPLPLAMAGGDPYLRALMRTISASESNMDQPYNLLYGGQTVSDLSRHPEQCVTIVSGPNQGNCSTAAGRYQFLDITWASKAAKYHPQQPAWYAFWGGYSFEPADQDQVMYNWLADADAWGFDIAATLAAGDLTTVLQRLSGTWTSLGYGIETNSMSSHLPQIYQKMLAQELAAMGN